MESKKQSTNELLKELLSRMDLLLRAVAELKSQREMDADGSAGAGPHLRIPAWALVRDYLQSVGGKSTPRNIAEALVSAGHDLGRYPLRNVKITVTSPHLRHLFRLKKDSEGVEWVMLMEQQMPQYTPPRANSENSVRRK